ncbi:HEAT repeat domain-containing protein [Synechococcus sp. A15-60]|uniref:HEAT repeat domain-containing protein n=1 Tax=Synechococcus sp. A15-60 TaxID=1050655 RepID=UPI002104A301|nr:HEAT repeat domain-containing protein [Synechococcus sp. A15-60]
MSHPVNEAALWERLSQSRRAPLEPHWLGEVYSPSLSIDLRRALSEKLGMLADRGWPEIKSLINQHGALPDLVLAAGLCHQKDARNWLLDQLTSRSKLDDINLSIVQALSCWGADVPETVMTESLRHPGQQHRLAGLQLLSFRAHTLSDEELLRYCSGLLHDFRDPVVIAAIRVLQRRDGSIISNRLAQLCIDGSDEVAAAALRALGCIATPSSQSSLLELSKTLSDASRQQLAQQQLEQQFRS